MCVGGVEGCARQGGDQSSRLLCRPMRDCSKRQTKCQLPRQERKRVDVHEDGNSSDVWRITGQRKVNAEDIPHDTIHRILRTANLSVALS